MGDLGLQWEASMSAFLGQNARVKSVQMKEGKQLVEAGSASRVRLLTRKLLNETPALKTPSFPYKQRIAMVWSWLVL